VQALENWKDGKDIAANGWQMVSRRYSKKIQWEMFQELLG
jgi:hypothetical protein